MERFKVGQAPWEKAQTPAPTPPRIPVGQAPWEKANPQDIPVVNEQGVGFGERAIVKNFSNSPEATIKFLESKGYETALKNGEVVVRKPGEQTYKKVDPSGLDLQDVTDLAYDIPSGVAQGIATGAAGAAAGAATGGVGTIPAAMATGAATSAGSEALRQKIGQYLGIPQEVNTKDVMVSGALGAASPLLFGSGASAKQLADAAAKTGGRMSAEELAKSQASPALKALKGTVKTAVSGASGVPKKVIETYAEQTDKVDDLIKNDAAPYVENLHQKIQDKFFQQKKQVGQRLEEAARNANETVETSRVFGPIRARIDALKQSEMAKTPAGAQEIEILEKEFNAISEGLPAQVNAKTALELQDYLKQNADFSKIKDNFKARYGASSSRIDKLWSDANADAYRGLNKELDRVAETGGIKKEYREYIQLQDKLQKHFGDPEKTYKTLSGLDAPSREFTRKTVQDLKTKTGLDLQKDADVLEAYKYFRDPNLTPISSGGSTSTTRTLIGTGLGAGLGAFGGPIGSTVGAAAGTLATSPAAVKAGTKAVGGMSRALAPYSQTLSPIPQRMSPWVNMSMSRERN